MPLLENDRAIKEYYEQEKHKYPDMSFDDFREICRSPAQFFKECIKGHRLPRIFVKYLGKFRVFPSKLKQELVKYKRLHAYGIIDEDTMKQNTVWAEYHLANIQKEIDENTEIDEDDEEQAID